MTGWQPLYAIETVELNDDSSDVRLVPTDGPIAVRTFPTDALYGVANGAEQLSGWIAFVVRELFYANRTTSLQPDAEQYATSTRWIQR